jgi:hypothetical protein
MFLVGRKLKTTVFTVFLNTGIYAGFTTMLQDVASISEKDKNTVNYSVWVCS